MKIKETRSVDSKNGTKTEFSLQSIFYSCVILYENQSRHQFYTDKNEQNALFFLLRLIVGFLLNFCWICPISPSNCFLYFWFVKNMSFLVLSVNLCISQKFSVTLSCIAIIDSHFLIQYFLFHCLSHTVAAYTQTIPHSHTIRCLAFSVPLFARYALHRIHIMKTVGVHSAYRNV